ncbi:MAG: hypothetical protein IH940_14405, partial [Acidobacteria bacterium]|nr:hypothetical protein [Acidobacteriota bacterium]
MTTSRTGMFRALLAPTIVLVLLAASCGDDDGTVSLDAGDDTSTTTTATATQPETTEVE